MTIVLQLAAGHVELLAPEPVGLLRRPLEAEDAAALASHGRCYRDLAHRRDGIVEAALLALGRELHGWLDGEAGWLRRLRAALAAHRHHRRPCAQVDPSGGVFCSGRDDQPHPLCNSPTRLELVLTALSWSCAAWRPRE